MTSDHRVFHLHKCLLDEFANLLYILLRVLVYVQISMCHLYFCKYSIISWYYKIPTVHAAFLVFSYVSFLVYFLIFRNNIFFCNWLFILFLCIFSFLSLEKLFSFYLLYFLFFSLVKGFFIFVFCKFVFYLLLFSVFCVFLTLLLCDLYKLLQVIYQALSYFLQFHLLKYFHHYYKISICLCSKFQF